MKEPETAEDGWTTSVGLGLHSHLFLNKLLARAEVKQYFSPLEEPSELHHVLLESLQLHYSSILVHVVGIQFNPAKDSRQQGLAVIGPGSAQRREGKGSRSYEPRGSFKRKAFLKPFMKLNKA